MSNKEDKPVESTKDTKQSASDRRRRLVTKLAIGGAAGASIPAKWTKPVVDGVMLPAHAQTTEEPGIVVTVGGGGGGGGGAGPAPSNSMMDDVVDFFVNPARAGGPEVDNFCVVIRVREEVTKDKEGVVTSRKIVGVRVRKVCHDACKPGVRWYDQTDGNVDLSKGPGGTWTGMVGNFNVPIIVDNVNTQTNKIADVQLGDETGEIFKDQDCDCSCPR